MEICLFFLLEDRKALGNSGVGNCIDLSQVAEGNYQVVMDSTTHIIILNPHLNFPPNFLEGLATSNHFQQIHFDEHT